MRPKQAYVNSRTDYNGQRVFKIASEDDQYHEGFRSYSEMKQDPRGIKSEAFRLGYYDAKDQDIW